MTTDIRKISVGKDFPDGAMHYQVGKNINLQGTPYTITLIDKNSQSDSDTYDIYITDGGGTLLWKSISGMPVVVENNIDFD